MKDSKLIYIIIFGAFPILLAIALAFHLSNMSKSFHAEMMQSLEEVSEQSVNTILTEIENKQGLLRDLASTVEIDTDIPEDELLESIGEQLRPVAENRDLYSIGIVTADRRIYTADGRAMKCSDLDYMDGMDYSAVNISERIYLEYSDTNVNIYSSPVYDESGSEQIAAVFAAYETNQLRNSLEVISYDGEGYSYLVNAKGDVVVDSNNPHAFQDMTNVYTSMEKASGSNSKAVNVMKSLILKKQSGYTTYVNQGVEKYVYCAPIGVNDWYLLTIVPVSVVQAHYNKVLAGTWIFALITVAIFVVLFLILMFQQRGRQEELINIAYVDSLTGGPTFAKFQEEYRRIVPMDINAKYAIINFDLRKFKMLNDIYGYDEGDRIIKMMYSLWEEKLNADKECIAHRSADRFVVLMLYNDKKDIYKRLEEYRDRLQEEAKGKYKLNLSVGVYEVRYFNEDFETAFDRSMIAFSAAKNSRDKFVVFYNDAMEENLVWEQFVEDHFQEAIEKHEFKVYYQAKVSALTGKVSGAEALVRWIRSDGSVVFPGKFIPVLENNGMIAELDRYMFQEVVNHQKAWLDQGIPIVPVSVNLSRVQLAEQNFFERYKKMLEQSSLPSKYVSLEFTESAMFDNEEILRDTVNQIHDAGMKVLIDDFGVGFSSMMTLKTIPADIMKVDKCFVDSIGDERGNKIIIGLIEFAVSLGMSVTAEGVEDEHQYLFLKEHNCNDIQGYYFARPIPAEEYCEKFLKTA